MSGLPPMPKDNEGAKTWMMTFMHAYSASLPQDNFDIAFNKSVRCIDAKIPLTDKDKPSKIKVPPMPKTNDEAKEWMNSLSAYTVSLPQDNFDVPFNKSARCVDAKMPTPADSRASATFEFAIPKTYKNNPATDTVHGTAVALFFDNLTSVPLFLMPGWEGTSGVSQSLSVRFLRAPREGEKCVVECEVVNVGKRAAVVRGTMRRVREVLGGEVLAVYLQDKVKPEKGGYRL